MNDQFQSLVEMAADVDETLIFKRKDWGRLRHLGDLAAFRRSLGQVPWDWVFDLQGLFRSGMCTYFARSERKVGFEDAREGARLFYDERVKPPAGTVHAVEKNLYLVGQSIGVPPVYEPPLWNLPDAATAGATKVLAEHGLADCRYLLAVGSTSRWESKSWPPAFFADVLRRVAETIHATGAGRLGIWLAGGPDEVAVGEAVLAAGCPEGTISLFGKTDFNVLLALLARSQAMLTNDTGPMHLAAALDVPTVALFGPTDPAKTGPYGDRHRTIATAVACAPCLKRVCPLPKQLCRDDMATPERVAAAVVDRLLLGQARGNTGAS